MSEDDGWAARRRADAQLHAERLERRRAQETEQARRMIAAFTAEAHRRGLTPRPLLAKAGDGRPTYRTGLSGWYLTRDGMFGVTTDGEYHVLVSPVSLRARLFGVASPAADPPLQVGAGARDGESIALEALLELRLDAGDDWPVEGL